MRQLAVPNKTAILSSGYSAGDGKSASDAGSLSGTEIAGKSGEEESDTTRECFAFFFPSPTRLLLLTLGEEGASAVKTGALECRQLRSTCLLLLSSCVVPLLMLLLLLLLMLL